MEPTFQPIMDQRQRGQKQLNIYLNPCQEFLLDHRPLKHVKGQDFCISAHRGEIS